MVRLLGLFAISACPSLAVDDLKVAGGYLMMQRGSRSYSRDDPASVIGLQELQAVASHAATIPVNRIWVAFFSPTLFYKPGTNSFNETGMETGSSEADMGFAEVKTAIKTLQDNGVEVFLSLGGWNYNCFPAIYTRYSIGGYGTHTPNYWKIQEYGDGNIDNCNEANMWCYSCEPKSEDTTIDSFSIFPEPKNAATWTAATKYIESKAGGKSPEWHPDVAPGEMWTDSKTGTSLKVPGSSRFNDEGRDPYVDFVSLANDLGAAGVDLDYEEFWHADYFKSGTAKTGPWELDQTVYKYGAIAKDMVDAIDKIAPKMKFSTAAGAVGAWGGKWWGGNLKGVWLKAKQWFPDVMSRVEINVMTYDLSSNNDFHECPTPDVCALDKQVDFYMKTYRDGGFKANVGYEVGQPAYPPASHDKAHQLPLTPEMLTSIVEKTQSQQPGGFFWEMYKGDAGHSTATDVAQALCKKVLGDEPRCSGEIPPIGGPSPTPTPSPSPSPTPSGKYRCTSNQCVSSSSGGVALETCNSICGDGTYKCVASQCVAAEGGVSKDICSAVCGGSDLAFLL